MSPSPRVIRAALLVAAAAVLAAAAIQLRDKRETAELTVENMRSWMPWIQLRVQRLSPG